MKKINMARYGFIRTPALDFSDDGTRFNCYRVGERVRVTKAIYKGEAYIDGSIDGTKLPYYIYSKLPHYNAVSKLNGVSIESLTDQDLIGLYEDCLAYEQEYINAENTVRMPTAEDIKIQYKKIQEKRVAEFKEVEALLSKYAAKLALKLPAYKWSNLQDYFIKIADESTRYDPEQMVSRLLGTSASHSFCKSTNSALSNCYYYNYIIECIKSVQDE